MMCERVRVITRCRPFNKKELREGTETIVDMDPMSHRCYLRTSHERKKSRIFSFDGVYGAQSTTEEIYTGIVHPIVAGVLDGYNGTVFAYGQTSCGKTFTMQGIEFSPSHKGIIPRCCEHIFNSVKKNGNRADRRYLVQVSYLEIYNEVVRDLLVRGSSCKLEIKEHPERGIYVKGLSCIAVDSLRDIEEILSLGSGNRSVGSTQLNSDSSRSHSIFIIDLEVCMTDEDSGKEVYRTGKLNLVDLAGSERQSKSGATGDRFKEATKINLSLSVLGNVISALVDSKAKHVPYRDSKLTRLLQDSLGGNSRTLMVACISPGANNYDETLSTLRYAKRAKSIRNKPRINADPKDSLLQKYHDEISLLKRIIAREITMPQGLASELNGSAEDVRPEISSVHKDETESKLREYRVQLLQTQRLHSEACEEAHNLRQELDNLKSELRIQQRRTEHERRRRELEEHRSALLLMKSRRVTFGASGTAIYSERHTRNCHQVTSQVCATSDGTSDVTSDTKTIVLTSDKVTSQKVMTVQKTTSFEVTSREVKGCRTIPPEVTFQRFISESDAVGRDCPDDIELNPDYLEEDSSSGGAVDSKELGEKFSDEDICDKEVFEWDVDELEREAPLAEGESPYDDEGESPLSEEESSHDEISHRGEAEGRSRSTSPRTGDKGLAKQSREVPDVLPPRKLEVEDPVPLALCCLCAGVSFFGEKNYFVTSKASQGF